MPIPVDRPTPSRAAPTDSATGAATLRRGDGPNNGRADDVGALQQQLNLDGARLVVDGMLGPKTEAAVYAFQIAHGLRPDGVAGPETHAALERLSHPAPVAPPTPAAPPAPTRRAPVPPQTQSAARVRHNNGSGGAPPSGATLAGPAATATASIDVGAVTPDQLIQLRSSSNPAVRAEASTVARAQKAYADHMSAGGKVLVSTSAANGGQPVVTLVPPGFDPSKPARVETHYHGWNATAADAVGHTSGTTARIAEIQRADPQAVFVLPECKNAQGGDYHADWSNVRSQAQTTADALRGAGVDNIGTRIVSAHSAGGFALQRAMQSKSDGSGIQADRLELQDCLYGPEKDIAAWASTPAGRAAKDVLYFHGTNERGRDAGIARAFGGRYRRIEVPAPHDVPFIAGTHIRKYAADAHDRTVGEFMDSVPGPF